jgi:hypothetical protein
MWIIAFAARQYHERARYAGRVMAIEPPVVFGWGELVEHFVSVHGSLVAVADELGRRMRLAGEDAPELGTAVKGLQRLASRSNEAGGQYGRWMLRHFGVPGPIEVQLRSFAQYHSRFCDLPTSVRRDHLRLWERPPTSESRLLAWVHVGLASIHHRRQELDPCRDRLAAARRAAIAAGPAAQMEALLLAARIATDEGRFDEGPTLLDEAEALIDERDADHLCYRARLNGQRAFWLTHARTPSLDAHARARDLFLAIPADSGIPFVDYRRTAGLAYCAWKLGDPAEGVRLARLAAEHAGDGGFIRFRVMAFNMLARMLGGDEAIALRQRAERLARSIEDFHLEEVARMS